MKMYLDTLVPVVEAIKLELSNYVFYYSPAENKETFPSSNAINNIDDSLVHIHWK